MTADDKPLLCRRGVAAGLLFWALFCVAAVMLRGVRWDEQYEFAQVITGDVAYPQGHPYPYCVRNALNLQIYATSALHWLTHSPAIVCGFRNVLYLVATVAPVYLLGALLGGSTFAGHAAAVLILLGTHEEFDACYQMFAWPQYASTGHIGLGYALAALAMLAGGHLRAGLFMLGLMPCVHIGQMPVLLGCCILSGALILRSRPADLQPLLRAVPWAMAGLAICAAVWLAKGAVNVPLPDSGPYVSTADPQAVWAGYVSQDPLRALPGRPTSYTNSFIALAASVLVLSLTVLRWNPRSAIRNPQSVVWLYVAVCAAAVWGVLSLHYMLGDHVPYVLMAWMPYRFANHAVHILIPAVAAILCRSSHPLLLPAALVLGALRPLTQGLIAETTYARYIAGGEGLLFFLVGAACFAGAACFTALGERRNDATFVGVGAVVTFLCALALALVHQFGFACAIVGFVIAAAVRSHGAAFRRTASAALAVALIGVTTHQMTGRSHLSLSNFDIEMISCLHSEENDTAMVLARPEQYTLQARTGHPVVADTCLAPWIPYMPSIGPVIEKIHRDFYGETFSPPHKPAWNELWRGRSQQDWHVLGERYSVRYVVSPNHVPLTLPVAVKGPLETLYRIP